ncbi:MAG: Wzz/FepE/Etk N-terminal domain-containing protein [Bacteroidota bacterium]|nr:Wzz/FepE/Etk N-terminal domain-containing protein [Bacteroidota bacterium]MDP4233947.1 Wzz/FepE/Etk N-terminal domain-containing protein [Bacteroidota bacterium]MDP4242802.1 Wzz/FepE/Etk N-terminal domain-containing protein [Bacteroidota bacterium]MDP4288516.1 Wzz/FepE/Etk N-terminal domain-containing protein [Bacteroidota bacterium]
MSSHPNGQTTTQYAKARPDFWLLLVRHVKLIILGAFLGGLVLFVYAKFLPETYQATATVLPPERSGSGGMLAFLANTSSAFDFLKNGAGADNPTLDLFKTIVESRTIAEDVARDSIVHDYLKRSDTSWKGIVGQLQGSLSSEAMRTGMFTVSIKLRTPRFPSAHQRDSVRMMTAYIANTFVSALDRFNRDRLMTSARNTRVFIEAEHQLKMAQLDSSYARLQQFQETHQAISLPEQLAATVSAAATLTGQIQQTEMELGVESHELEASSPRVKALTAQLDASKAALAKYDDGGAGEYVIALKNAPALARELAGYMRETKVLEQVTGFLRQELEEQRINEERDLPSLQILDRALPPTGPTAPNTKLFGIVGLILGLFGTMGFVWVRSFVLDIRDRPAVHYRLVNIMRTARHGKRATLLAPTEIVAEQSPSA